MNKVLAVAGFEPRTSQFRANCANHLTITATLFFKLQTTWLVVNDANIVSNFRDEILELLGKPTAKERSLIDKFRSQTGGGVRQFCSHSTKKECMKVNGTRQPCANLHFAKIIQVRPHRS